MCLQAHFRFNVQDKSLKNVRQILPTFNILTSFVQLTLFRKTLVTPTDLLYIISLIGTIIR